MLDRGRGNCDGRGGMGRISEKFALCHFGREGPLWLRFGYHSFSDITLSLKNAWQCSGRAIILIVYYYSARYCTVLLYAV